MPGALPAGAAATTPSQCAHPHARQVTPAPERGYGCRVVSPSREADQAHGVTRDDDRRGTLAEAVDWLVRADGRSPRAELAVCLSLEERALCEVLGELPVQEGAAPPELVDAICHVAVYDYGRPSVSLRRPEGRALEPRAWAHVRPDQLAAIERARAALAEEVRGADTEVNALLDALPDNALARLVLDTADSVDHNDPVQLFVDDQLFGNVDPNNNLYPKPGNPPDPRYILCRLQETARGALSVAERRFLGVFLLLREAGLRAEELNGRQFTPWALSSFFEEKYQQCRRALESVGDTGDIEGFPAALIDRARCLKRLKERVLRTHRVYRWIDAYTFRKEERFRPRDPPPLARDLPTSIVQHCRERFGVSPAAEGHHDPFFAEVVRRIAHLDDDAARSRELEALLEVVVRSAMREAPSPIGMTRGMRDLRHLQDALEEGRYADVCATPFDDGYCAVFARDDAGTYDLPLAKVLRAISRRMQFNHRHYLPGHFDAAAVPARPHFYYPPSMSDLAEHGEHRHTGHTMARVRYSVRSPAPLIIAGKSWTGLVDIRVMRTVGHPYSNTDLVTIDRHTEYIRSIAQAVVELKAAGLRAPVIRHDSARYEERYPEPAGRVAAAPLPRPTGPAIGLLLREAMARHGDAGAITAALTGNSISLVGLRALAERLAAAAGGRAGCRLSLVCADRSHQAALIVAGLAAGMVVCPVDHAMPARAREALLRHAAPDLVITDGTAVPLPEPFARTALRAETLLSDGAPRGALPESDAGGLLIYTSGATGAPKGVLLDEHQLGANVSFACDHFGYQAKGRWTSACLLPLHHTFAIVSDLLPVLCAGGQVVILPGFATDDVATTADALNRYAVRSFSAVPLILEAMLALSAPLPSSMLFAISGAAPLAERTRARYRERYGHPIVPCYGLTETVCFATASPVDGGRAGSAGRAAGIALRIVGEDLLPLPVGQHGEVAVRGSSVITSYFRSGPEGAAACIEDGWFLTGDLGRLDDDGYLYVTGRRKNMLIRGGEKLYLEDLDLCLEEHPAIAEACSVQIPGMFGFERAVTFLVRGGGSSGDVARDEESIRAHIRDRLGALGMPDELRWIDRIPRSATGKPLREALRMRGTEST